MAKRSHTSLYFADDRDVYDLLEAATRNLPMGRLFTYAKSRGLFLSEKDGREAIVDVLSSLTHSWGQMKSLLDATDTPDRIEKKTSRNPPTTDRLEQVEKHFATVREERSEEWDEVYVINRHEDRSLCVTVQYTEMDTRKTRLFQRRMREITFQVIPSTTGIKIRHEANDRAYAIAKSLIQKLTVPATRGLNGEIDLSSHTDPVIRTKFFMHLMTKMSGFRFQDVAYLDVDRVAVADAQAADSGTSDEVPEGPESSESSEESEDTGTTPPMTAEAIEMKGVVTKATLQGEGLLRSAEFIQLKDKGFFISHAVWHAVEDKDDGKRVEFQAQFENGSNATGFKYSVRKVFERFENGKFKKGPSELSSTDLDTYESLVETTSNCAMVECVRPEALPPAATGMPTGDPDSADEAAATDSISSQPADSSKGEG